MGLRRNFEPVLISSLVITRRRYHQGRRLVPHPQTNCRRTRVRCRDPDHIGCSVLSSLVRACWWCWLLWRCFTRTTITLVEPKSGSWRGDSWCRRVRQLLHRGINDIIMYQTRSLSCRTVLNCQYRTLEKNMMEVYSFTMEIYFHHGEKVARRDFPINRSDFPFNQYSNRRAKYICSNSSLTFKRDRRINSIHS